METETPMVTERGPLHGRMLVAMPGMPDPRFAHSVIYMCAHSDDGAMGLIVNRIVDSLDFSELLTQVGVDDQSENRLAIVSNGISLQDLVDGLNALGVGPRDLIAILQAIKAAGALQAEIEVM